MPRYKTPPHNDEAEQSVIGSVFIDNSCLPHIDLSPIDFYHSKHQILWKAILELSAAGIPIDFITVTNHLKKSDLLDAAGGIPEIAATIDSVPTAMNVPMYAKILKDKSARRKFIEQMRGLAVQAYDDEPMENIIDDAQVTFRYILEDLGSTNKKSVAEEVREWLLLQTGYFKVTTCYHELQFVTKEQKAATRVCLHRLLESGVIEKYAAEAGKYRRVENQCEAIDFLTKPDTRMDIKYPFALESLIYTMPKNIMVVAGSPDSGKTAFFLNFVHLNQDKYPIHYFSSEMGSGEFHERLKNFGYPMTHWKFTAKERGGDFADVIVPEAVNIVDFLECHEDFWKMGGAIKAIFDKLTTGIALIGIQKAPGASMGRGGVGTLEKPRLYLSMEKGVCKIEKAKNWMDGTCNPNGNLLKYRLVHGCKYIIDEDWHKEDVIVTTKKKGWEGY